MPAVNKRIFKSKWTKLFLEFAALVVGLQLLLRGCAPAEENSEGQHVILQGIWLEALAELDGALADTYMPVVSLVTENEHETYWFLQEQVDTVFPAYRYFTEGMREAGVEQSPFSLAEIETGNVRESAFQNESSLQNETLLQNEDLLHWEDGLLHGDDDNRKMTPH